MMGNTAKEKGRINEDVYNINGNAAL